MRLPDRATILFAPFDGWDMPAYGRLKASWIAGGVRSLLELAAGLAAVGLDVELRGAFAESEVAAIEHAAGVDLGRPNERRRPLPDELVIIPEGHDDPLIFARVALSPARAVLMMLGPLGLVGWPFDETPIPDAAGILTLDTGVVGRPESLMAARSFGLELWTNARGIAARGTSVGIDVHHVGAGRPTPYPEPREKSVDVLMLSESRWAPLAREAFEAIPERFSTWIQPPASHAELLAALGAARVFLHPARIEGRSRLCEEARAMRAVPVLLASNIYGEGYGPEYGSIVVESVHDMATAAVALLNDPERLGALEETGYRTARQQGDWEAYKQRLRAAVASPDGAVATGAYVRSQLGRRIEDHQRPLLRLLEESQQERERLVAEAEALRKRMAELWTQLDETATWAHELNKGLLGLLSSSSWKATRPLRATMKVLRRLLRMARG